MAQHPSVPPEWQRVPMMSAKMLDARTRPPAQEPMPIWLRHRLQRRHMRETTTAPRGARGWLRDLRRRASDRDQRS